MIEPDYNSLKRFFETGRLALYSKGEIVEIGDEEKPEVSYILSGFIKVYSINDQGDEYLHIIFKEGEIFPLIWALKGVRRHVFYEAMTPVQLRKLPRDRFIEHLELNTDKISYALLAYMADLFNLYADRLDNLQYKSAYERVVYRLLYLASRFGKKQRDGILIDAPITHKVVAESINLARESVSRELEKLVARGLIETKYGKIVIKNVHKLAEEFSEPVSLDLWGLDKF